ncbi:MAG: tetratricopeptide repeat protein, partial [Phycisphaerales bacterium]|nr:tetratricopeptide repeat protein [Phycisphaerales bacterium]
DVAVPPAAEERAEQADQSAAEAPAVQEEDAAASDTATPVAESSAALGRGSPPVREARFERAFVKGRRFMTLGKHAEAAQCFREALTYKEQDVQAHYQLGLACVMSDDMAGAREEVQVLNSLDRSLANLLRNLIR